MKRLGVLLAAIFGTFALWNSQCSADNRVRRQFGALRPSLGGDSNYNPYSGGSDGGNSGVFQDPNFQPNFNQGGGGGNFQNPSYDNVQNRPQISQPYNPGYNRPVGGYNNRPGGYYPGGGYNNQGGYNQGGNTGGYFGGGGYSTGVGGGLPGNSYQGGSGVVGYGR